MFFQTTCSPALMVIVAGTNDIGPIVTSAPTGPSGGANAFFRSANVVTFVEQFGMIASTVSTT